MIDPPELVLTCRACGEDYDPNTPCLCDRLPDADAALLLFIHSYRVANGRLPRLREIAEARGMSRHDARSAVRRLRAVGQLPQYDRWFPAVPFTVVERAS